ncbi:MAG: ABC transporter ATP-binding protein [Actinobacteria bacterium]|nr:ABC transporter ATP-binding protein [Actinomycetota bacterium]
MASSVRCKDLRKLYPGAQEYSLGSESEGVSIEIEEGEIFAIVGPTGCGKTTTLRIIGGFTDATSGTVEIGGRDVTGLRAYQRPTNTVFQSYALFPHLSVISNVEFGLTMERVGRAERKQRASEALDLVGLLHKAQDKPSSLSGGQAQRVALARAIVKRPAVLLLDEPLGALDRKTRQQMQEELVRLKQAVGITFVHVTHDQEEACAIADRIAVMDRGRVAQIEDPVGLFRGPRTSYVASFIDAGTIVRGTARRTGDVVEIDSGDLSVRGECPAWLNGSADVAAVLAPDRVKIARSHAEAAEKGVGTASGTVNRTVFTGSVFEVYVDVSEELEVRSAMTADEVAALGEALSPGSRVDLTWEAKDVMVVEDNLGTATIAEAAGVEG